MTVKSKICGLTKPADIEACADAGAAYVGFTFFPKSPRFVSVLTAQALAIEVPVGIAKVALVVDPSDEELDAITGHVAIDMLQLHGQESPERVTEIRTRYGLPVMKAIGIADEDDLPSLDIFSSVADQILVEAKAPKTATRPGGNGLSFDWRLISTRRWSKPWMLAGGLNPDNVGEAIALTGATQVDVSSGVESAPGQKSRELVQQFVSAASAGSGRVGQL